MQGGRQLHYGQDRDKRHDSYIGGRMPTWTPTRTLKDAMVAKSLASDITEIGAKLHGLLNCEVKNKELRERVIRFLSSVTGAAEYGPEKYYHLRNSLALTVDAESEYLRKIEEQCKELEIDERDLAENI